MNRHNLLKVAIGLALAGFALFGQSINDPFHFDDALIAQDSNVSNPAAWSHFLNPLHLRQLTFFSFYLNHLVSGNNPTSYHLVNVVLHTANSILFYALLTGFVDRRLALIAASIFLVHPIQTEPVMYVYQRSLLLACFFSLLALLAVQRDRWAFAVVLFLCAFESKESALAVPLLLAGAYLATPLFASFRTTPSESGVLPNSAGGAPECSPARERWVFGGRNLSAGGATESTSSAAPAGLTAYSPETQRSRVGLHSGAPQALFYAAGLFVSVLILSGATLAILAHRGESTVGIGAAGEIMPFSYLLTQTRVMYTYLRLLMFPFPQSLEYDFPSAQHIGMQEMAQIAGLLGLLIAGVYLARRKEWRITGYSILALFILLAPTSSIIPSVDAAFEHRLYLPMLAFSVFAASLITKLRRPTLIAAPVLAVLCIMTINRGTIWGSDIRLWEDTVRHVPNKARAWFNLGGAYLESDQNRAQQAFKRTVELSPDFAEAYYNLGVIEQTKHSYAAAVGYYRKTINLNSSYWPAWNNLGNTLLLLGERERALEAFETTLRLNPDHWPSQYNIAIVHFNSGRFDQAIPRLRTVLDWRPDFRDARYLLAVALTRTGRKAEAEREWQKIGNNIGQPPLPAAIPGLKR